MATFKNEVLIRVYIVVFAVVLVAVAIFAKAVRISVLEGKIGELRLKTNIFRFAK